MKKIFKLKRTYFVLMLMILSVFVASLLITTDSNQEATFVPYTNYYNSDKYVITSASAPNDENVIGINELYTINGSTITVKNNYATLVDNKTITISNAEELYAFSSLANSISAFLGYSYKLISSIDYSNYNNQFIPIGWNGGTFTGTFDGYGYEINSLRMLEITTTDSNKYQAMTYFAMFLNNSGTVSNFGLVEPRIRIMHSSPNMLGVATVVGNNSGEVSFVYVKDNRDVEDAGIYATGGHRISGLVSNNEGSVSDCYVTYTRVVNYAVSDYIDFNELLSDNSGQISNLFFYNSSIETYTPNGDKETVEYIDSIGKTYTDRSKFGTYNNSIDALNDAVYESTASNTDNKWYASNSYTGIEDEIGLETPITRGISYNSTTKEFTINNEDDYSFMYELMNSNAVFASDQFTYLINNNINLALLNPDNYYYSSNIAATIKGVQGSYTSTTLSNGSTSAYPTIFNPSFENYVLVEGIECYGTFPYLSGNVADLNIAFTNYNLEIATSGNQKSVGIVCGYTDGADINNVNVYYNTFTIDSNIGSYYFGSIAGVITNETVVSNTTAKGSYNDSNVTASTANSGNFDKVISIGGLVGYISNTLGNVNNSLSAVNLTITGKVTGDLAVGGVIGSGYTTTIEATDENNNDIEVRTSNLENNGTITISNNVTATNLYVGGVLGCQFGMADQVTGFNNEGDITLNGVASTNTYVAGVANANLNEKSQLALSGMRQYFASAFTNGADVTVNTVKGTVNYSYVINIKENGYQSKVSGIYNLGYKENTTLGIPTIDMDLFTEFSPVINYIGGSSTYTLAAETVYNLRSYNFELSGTPNNTTFTYTGAIKGNNINYTDIRNEGNLTFNLTPTINNSTLNVSGLFDNLNNGFTANNLFNDGNITVNDNSTNNKYLDIYIAGICRVNNAVLTESEQNPLNSNFDNTLVGSLNNAINNGDILVTSTNLEKDTVSNADFNKTPGLYSDMNVGGVAVENTGIISNAFNLGNVDLELYSKQVSNYNVGGIACVNNGQYAQIRDCANNGDLSVIDICNDLTSIVNVGGIVSHNTTNAVNINQVIAFTINYGTINAYQANPQFNNVHITAGTMDNIHATAGGIMGQGLCNMVNILNYGSVYSSECAGGLASVVDLDRFNTTDATIANTVNYGRVLINPLYYNEGGIKYLSINEVKGLGRVEHANYVKGTYTGALITVFDFASKSNVDVRYLINLFNESTTVAYNFNVPNTDLIDTSTFITANAITDTFGGKLIKYAPLTNIEDDLGNIGVFSEEFVFRKAINGIGLDDNYVTDKYITEFFQFVRFDKVNEELLKSMGWQTIAYADAAENLAKNLEALSTLIKNSNKKLNSYTSSLIQSEELFAGNTWIENSDTTILTNFIELSVDSNELDDYLYAILEEVLFGEYTSDFTSELRSELFEIIMGYYEQQELDYYELLNKLLYPELVAKIISGDTSDYAKVQEKVEEVLSASTNLNTIYNNYVEVLTNEDANNITDTNSVLYTLFDNNSNYYKQTKVNLLYALLEGYNEDTLMDIYNQLDISITDASLKYLIYLQANTSEATKIYKGMIEYNSISDNEDYLDIINNRLLEYDFNSIDSFENIEVYKELFSSWDADGTIQDILSKTGNIPTSIKTINTLTPTLPVIATKNYTELWNIIKNDVNVQDYISKNYFNEYTDPSYGIKTSGLLAKATEWNNSYQSNDKPQSYYGIAEDDRGGINYGGEDATTDMPATRYPDGTALAFTADNPIVTRFIYTPDHLVSYSTNYFGPFMSNGQVYSAGGNISSNNYNLGWDLSLTDTSSDMKRNMVPIFIGSNPQITADAISDVTSTSNKRVYEFYWNNSNNDNGSSVGNAAQDSDYHWKYKDFATVAANNTDGYLIKNYNSGEYIYDYYDFTPGMTYTRRKEHGTTTKLPTGETIRMVNPKDKDTSYRDYFFTGYCSSAKITGIFYSYSMWAHDSGNKLTSLIAKNETPYAFGDNDGYLGVHTTDYIDYQLDDLVKLDGIRTRGLCSDPDKQDNDEINIISAIVENMLVDADGQKAILKAIGNYGKANGYTKDNELVVNTLLYSLSEQASFGSNFVINSLEEMFALEGSGNDIWYNDYFTIKEYLDDLNIVLDNVADEIVSASVSNLDNFRKVILLTHELCQKIALYTDYDYNRSGVNKFIYNYILDEYNYNNLTAQEKVALEDEINNALSSATAEDLSYIRNLFTLTATDMFIEDETYSEFTIINSTLYTSYSNMYDSIEYEGITYNQALFGSQNSSVEFTTGDWEYGYGLDILFNGTITLYESDGTEIGEITLDEYDYDSFELESNTSYYITFNDTSILNLELYEQDGEEYIRTDKIYYNDVVSPFVTLDSTPVKGGDIYNVSYSGGTYEVDIKRDISLSDGEAVFVFSGLNINGTISSITSNTLNFTLTSETNTMSINMILKTENEQRTVATMNNPQKEQPVNYTNIALPTNVDEFELELQGSHRNTGNRWVKISNIYISTTFTLLNGTTVTITQYPLVSSSNSIRVSNANGIYTEINGTDYSTNTSATISDHTSNVTFKPYKYENVYETVEGTNIYSLNMTDIPIVDGDSFIYNFNNYYDSVGTMGKYLLQDLIVKQDNLSSVTITEPSFVVMKANTNGTDGTISVNGDTINVTSITPQYYIEYISTPGTYSISSSNSVTITDVFIVEGDKKLTVDNDGSFNIVDGYNTTELTDFNYPLISGWNFTSEYASLEGMTSIETFIETYPYYRENFQANRQNDVYQIISKLYGSIHQDANHPFVDQTDQGYYSIFKDAGFTEDDLREIIELLILADNTAYQTLITNLGSDYYDDILKAIKDPNMQANIMIKIRDIADTNNITEIQQLVEAAYLGNNYLDNLNTLDDTLMYDILDNYYENTPDEFLFINSDNSIDAVKFTNLINHLSGSSSVDLGGYGIFALSSSKGIGDGIFIPDNFVLSEMDTNYDANNKLIDQNEGYWRGGTASDDNAKTEDSVNHAFYVDMKQLKKSISTTIFTLDLEDNNGNIIYSSEELIDVENGTITYYVTDANDVSSVTIDRLVIANSASSNKDVGATLSLQAGENANQILITAEDTTVFTNYTIIIEVVDIAYNISSNVTTLDYVGGNVPITITSIDGKEIPANIDVTPYIWLVYVGSNGEEIVYQYGNEDSIYDIVLSSEDKDHIIDENGDTVATVIIPSDLITGTYRLYVSILGVDPTNAKYIQFTKNPSTEANMSSVRVDGVVYNFNANLEATTPIPFGRAYSDTELLDMSYLDYLPTFSVGADVEVTVEMEEDQTTKLVTYTVTYTITPEQGNPNVYKHYLVETAPYEVGDKYADWFIDGSGQDLDTYAGTNDHIYAEFDRGIEPLYRVRYIMDNFYTLGDVDYTYTISNMYTDSTAGVTASTLYAGISAVVTEMADVGTYEFEYTYTSKGTWAGVPYIREYTFPSLIVTKNASKDATFSRITFLDSDIIAGEMSTIINPDTAMLPNDEVKDTGELPYTEYTNGNQTTYVQVRDKTVNYEVQEGHDYATTDTEVDEFTNNFFVLGSVSDAKLAYYAPTFDAEDHAEVYQYTTLGKINNYGAGQTASDTSILANNIYSDTVLLYVPFVDANGNILIYLVQLENGKWTNVYNTDYDGSQAAIGNMNGDRTAEVNGCTVHESAGSPINNTSLYMDFIGDPAENHFWYVSYIVLSEDFLTDSTAGTDSFNNAHYKCYHISLIDMTNTVYYDITVETPEGFALESLYITLSYTTFDDQGNDDTKQISGYASENEEYESTTIDQYLFNNNLTVLPNGYYYFYVDLPDGYSAIYYVTNGKINRNDNPDYKDHDKEGFDGAYLPPASIVTQRVSITIEIVADSDLDQSVWAESTSSIYTKQIVYTTKDEEESSPQLVG